MSKLEDKQNKTIYNSAKWEEWAHDLWKSKRNDLFNEGKLGNPSKNPIKNLKILIISKKFKRDKSIWINRAQEKLAEMETKTYNQSFPKVDIIELLDNLKLKLEEELDELIKDFLEKRG